MKRVPVSKGKYFALVDDEDYERVIGHRWHAIAKKGARAVYAQTRIGKGVVQRRPIQMHRFILEPPSSLQVDHINHDGLDNRKHNLRICTMTQNMRNRPIQRNNKSGYKGVFFIKNIKRWRSTISHNGKVINIGWYLTPQEAAHAYNMKARELFGEFAYLNEIVA